MGTLGGAGADGLGVNLPLTFPLSADGSLPARIGFDQPTVENLLKQRMQDNEGWNKAHEAGFAGLPQGIPLVLGIITKLAEQITGIPVSEWVAQWQANPVVSNISTIAQQALGKIFTVLAHLQSLFGALNFTDPDFDPTEAWQAVVNTVLLPLNLFLGPDSQLNAANIVGRLRDSLFPGISIDSIFEENSDLQIASSFDYAESIVDNPDWTWDGDVGWNSPGSARATADGNYKVLFGNLVAVAKDQKITFTAGTKRQTLVWSGSAPLRMGVRKYGVDGSATDQELATYSPTSGTSGGFDNNTDMTGTYTVGDGVVNVRQYLVLNDSATSGTAWYDDAPIKRSGGWFSDVFGGVSTALRQIMDIFQGIEVTPIDEAVAGVKDWFGSIGTQFDDIIGDAQKAIDNFWGGFNFNFGASGKSSADVGTSAATYAALTGTSMELGEWNNAVLSLRNNKSLMEGVDETEEANFTLDSLWSGASPAATVSATSAAVPVAYKRFGEDAKKGFVTWFGKGIVSDLRMDIYIADYTANQWTLLHSSPNLASLADNTWRYLQYNISSLSDRIDVFSGVVLGIAWRVVGAGTHEIAGIPYNQPESPTVHPKRPVSVRTGSGNLAFGSTTYTPTSMPWFGIGIITGDVPPNYNAPREAAFTTTGSWSYVVPTWANYVDVVMSSAAGGGHSGDGGFAQKGKGGRRGEWKTETLVRGVDFPVGAVTIGGTIGVGGAGGPNAIPNGTPGGNGGNTTRAAISGGKAAMTATGGLGGDGFNSSDATGQTLPPITFAGKTYPGGAGGAPGGGGQPGAAPGGGGGGGNGGFYTVAWPGGKGGDGRVNVVARQT